MQPPRRPPLPRLPQPLHRPPRAAPLRQRAHRLLTSMAMMTRTRGDPEDSRRGRACRAWCSRSQRLHTYPDRTHPCRIPAVIQWPTRWKLAALRSARRRWRPSAPRPRSRSRRRTTSSRTASFRPARRRWPTSIARESCLRGRQAVRQARASTVRRSRTSASKMRWQRSSPTGSGPMRRRMRPLPAPRSSARALTPKRWPSLAAAPRVDGPLPYQAPRRLAPPHSSPSPRRRVAPRRLAARPRREAHSTGCLRRSRPTTWRLQWAGRTRRAQRRLRA